MNTTGRNRRRVAGGQATVRRRSAPGFTLIELLVVISIIGVLMAILFPAIQNGLLVARETQCASNLHQLALAASSYEGDAGELPNAYRWVGRFSDYWNPNSATNPYTESERKYILYPYVKTLQIYCCPAFQRLYPNNGIVARSYCMNWCFDSQTADSELALVRTPKTTSLRYPDKMVMFNEEAAWPDGLLIHGVAIGVAVLNDGRTCWKTDRVSLRDGLGAFHRHDTSIASFADGHTMKIQIDTKLDWLKWMDPRSPW